MNSIWFIFVLVLCISMSFARSRYLTIPWDNVQIMDIAERDDLGHQQIPLLRQRRHVISNKSSKFGGYHQGQPFAEASSQFEQANFNPHEYVDYGAHTGHHGAFGWYADFPVHQNH